MGGWIKLHRALKHNPIYKESKAVHCWIECLLRANHKEEVVYLKRDKIKLDSGMFVMGREEFGKSVGMSGSTAWYWLSRFEADSMVDIKKTTQGSIVTVLNWNHYQRVNSKKTAKKQQKNTYKKYKKVKNIKNKEKKEQKKENENQDFHDPFSKDVVKKFWVYIEKYHPNTYKQFIKKKEKTEKNWFITLDRLKRLDGLTEDEILKAIKNVINDDFWRKQFRTLSKLRKKDKEGVKYVSRFLDMSNEKDTYQDWLEAE